MGKWLRKDALCRQHPKFIRAGLFGGLAVDAAWEIAKAFDCDGGDITTYWSADYLARWLGIAADEDLTRLSDGMLRAERAGLVDRDGERVLIHDWAEHQPDTSTERVRRHRQRAKHSETVSPVSGNGETTHGTVRDRTGRDRDETRKAVSSSPASEAAAMARAREQVTVPCPKCHRPLILWSHPRNGRPFYSHGTTAGCGFKCESGEYASLAATGGIRQPYSKPDEAI